MIAEAYRDAIAMIDRHRSQLDRLASALMASGDLDRPEIAAALGEPPPRRHAHPEPGPRAEPALRPAPATAPTRDSRPRARLPRLAPVPAALSAFTRRFDRNRGAPAE